jgi:hypothetical protein
MTPMKAAAFSIALATAAAGASAEPEIDGARLAFEPAAIREIVVDLEAWLDVHTDLPRSDVPLDRIALIQAGAEVDYEGQPTRLGDTVRGLYDADTATIYLVRPWFGDTARHRSTLLHELVHHRQATAQHWYCDAAMEWDAYKTQDAYLAAHGETGGFNWAWVALVSSCAPRDHHPD